MTNYTIWAKRGIWWNHLTLDAPFDRAKETLYRSWGFTMFSKVSPW